MKRVLTHPEPSPAENVGPKYWRSLDDLSQEPAFLETVEREFLPGATEMSEVDRRHFLKIMAASFALGGVTMTGCRRPEAYILPYAKTPEQVIPGLPTYYASSFSVRGEAIPVLVETHAGRPTKIEGNPSFGAYGGRTTLATQASILDLYDPDRSTRHRRGRRTLAAAEWQDLLADTGTKYSANGGEGLAFVAEQSSSPTRLRLVRKLREKFPQAVWCEYEAVDTSAPGRTASKLLGRAVQPHYQLEKARRILSLDCDFLQAEPNRIGNIRGFTAGRRVEKSTDDMNRLYMVESHLSITGSNADHRFRLATSQIPAFAAALALELGLAVEGPLGDILRRLTTNFQAPTEWIQACARDLREHGRQSLVVAGSHLPEAVHALVFWINQRLGGVGETLRFLEVPAQPAATLPELAEAVSTGGVETLVILGGNPVYNAPVDLDWATRQASVGEVIRLGYYDDESSAKATVHLSQAHYLESWGDNRAADGTILPVQPMILPLFQGITEIEVLARILGEETPDPYNQVLQTLTEIRPEESCRHSVRRFLHDGLLSDSGYPVTTASLRLDQVTGLIGSLPPAPAAPTAQSLEVRFIADHSVDDGRFINNGWLQECPDPITKLTWDNAIYVSPRLGEQLGLLGASSLLQVARRNKNPMRDGRQFARIVTLQVGDRTLKGPVHVQPGLDNYTIVLPLGYGREKTGRVGEKCGFNAYRLRTSSQPAFLTGVQLSVTRATYQLANVQEHWSMEGRAIVREANLTTYQKTPDFTSKMGVESHSPPVFGRDSAMALNERVVVTPRGNSLYEHPVFDGTHQWGMTIDLNTCIGCNACVIACQSENNIPIVGRDQVRRGREMHWIRIDRYYSSGSADNREIPEDPQISMQPVTCLHCENAPCETVCPVNATVHDEEGLNVMAYNRCVGTRYCANNCPYKVRRFNFFDYHQRQRDKLYLGPLAPKGMPELLQMAMNPDVTVRMRGVMEKCTFCVQRIQAAKINQKIKAGPSPDVEVPDGTFQTACQQACPTDAIVFGNLRDPQSAVSKSKTSDRDYSLLGYLNTRPRLTYLSRLRNPNEAMPDYQSLPLSKMEYNLKNYGDPMGKSKSASVSSNGREGGLA